MAKPKPSNGSASNASAFARICYGVCPLVSQPTLIAFGAAVTASADTASAHANPNLFVISFPFPVLVSPWSCQGKSATQRPPSFTQTKSSGATPDTRTTPSRTDADPRPPMTSARAGSSP